MAKQTYSAIYHGLPATVGRHGRLSPGDKISLSRREWFYAQRHPSEEIELVETSEGSEEPEEETHEFTTEGASPESEAEPTQSMTVSEAAATLGNGVKEPADSEAGKVLAAAKTRTRKRTRKQK